MKQFKELELRKELDKSLEDLKYSNLTGIQENSLEVLLEGDNVVLKADTGSGKTLCFGIPLLNKLNENDFSFRYLIIAPTRELAKQIASELRKLSRYIPNVKTILLCGGERVSEQKSSLNNKGHIVVATPGRLKQHIQENSLDCDLIQFLVIDEADKMFDMGFTEDICFIFKQMKNLKQKILLSATFKKDIKNIADEFLVNYKFIETTSNNQNKDEHVFYKMYQEEKINVLEDILLSNKDKSTIVFVNQKQTSEFLLNELEKLDLKVKKIDSSLKQNQRDEIMVLFANKSYNILIATDLLSRGIDVDNVGLIINYDLVNDEKLYTHRVGRTNRNGNIGKVISFYHKDEGFKVDNLRKHFNIVVKDFFDDIKNETNEPVESFKTIFINLGKKDKVRAGDILGSLIKNYSIKNEDIGKINVFPTCSYIALKDEAANSLMRKNEKIIIKKNKEKIYLR